jgi:hypothetical protein
MSKMIKQSDHFAAYYSTDYEPPDDCDSYVRKKRLAGSGRIALA